MITLGQASNYTWKQVWRHLWAWGTQRDSERLRAGLAERYQVSAEQVALYHTGRSALTAALQSVAPQGGAQVIIPGLTCIAVVRAVRAAGCKPVFVDIVPENLEYNYQKLEQALQGAQRQKATKSQKAIDKNDKVCYNGSIILVQNTLGITWQAQKLEKLAQRYQAQLVEDLAHSAGRFYADGREVGMIGQAAALSFGKGKAIDTISGGAVILRTGTVQQPTRRPKWADRWRDRWYPLFGGIARGLWRCGLGKILIGGLVKIHWVQRSADAELDLEHRLTHWQAKLALRQLAKLPRTPLREYKLIQERSQALAELNRSGYCLEEIWYDTPVSPARYAEEADFPAHNCPETVKIAQQIINLPTWYPPGKLTKARAIIKKYEVKL